MTLAVAILYPPKDLLGFEASLGKTVFQRAIVLCSDSQFSDLSGKPISKKGAKIWPLSNRIGAVFASTHVQLTEMALSATKNRISKLKRISVERIKECAEDGFKTAWQNNHGAHVAHCFIGVVEPDGQQTLISLSSEDCFTPHQQIFNQVAGNTEAIQFFKQLLEDKSRFHAGYSTPGKMALRVADALNSTIAEGFQTVGGLIQLATITKDGLNWVDVFDINPSYKPAISDVSLKPKEARTASGRDRRRLGAGDDTLTLSTIDL